LPIRHRTNKPAAGRLPVGDWLARCRSLGPAGLALAAIEAFLAPLSQQRKSASWQPAPAACGVRAAVLPARCAQPRVLRILQPGRWLLALALAAPVAARGQIDPVGRELVQLGYNQAVVGHAPFSGYAFYYRNQPEFVRSNLALRLAVAPVYLDAELGVRAALGPQTDLGVGVTGGGFADSYNEIRGGSYRLSESFLGHGGEVAVSLYHLCNPDRHVPLHAILRLAARYAAFERDEDTAPGFALPEDHGLLRLRTGLRWGGSEPVIFPSPALELSVWYEFQTRSASGAYGFDADRRLEGRTHLLWGRAALAYTWPEAGHQCALSVTAGGSAQADRFSAYRLGAILPLVAEFALPLPGYYYQEISAERFAVVAGHYLIALDRRQRWSLAALGASAVVDYLPGLAQPGRWHSGVGGGLFYRSAPWQVMVCYGYGVDALRSDGRGGHSIGVLVQIDTAKTLSALIGPPSPFRSRGLFRLFGGS